MKKLIILIIVAGIMLGVCSSNDYVEIPSTSIRMRVIANSDSETDQSNKKIIKSAVEDKLYDITKDKNSYEDINAAIYDNLDLLDNTIQSVINDNSMNIGFKSNYGLNYFPEKEFKGQKYKAGNYNSYVVTLGEGEGENWWCVLYPPLCLVDENISDYEYHSLIKDTLEKYN